MSDLNPSTAFPSDLKPKWRERFEFFEQYGEPASPEFRAAFKKLPFGKRLLVNMSWPGFFFGVIYMFVLGMWRRALTWMGVIFAITIAEGVLEVVTGIKIPGMIDFGVSVAVSMLMGMTTNYSYYLKIMKGDNGWNPFTGVRWF